MTLRIVVGVALACCYLCRCVGEELRRPRVQDCTGGGRWWSYPCTNGKCIRYSLYCDGSEQCGDGSDEMGCSWCNKTLWANPYREVIKIPRPDEYKKGSSVYCTYDFLIDPAIEGHIIAIEMNKMKIGQLVNDHCEGGYMQIIDGFYSKNQSNRDGPGYFCGNPQRAHFFYSETNSIRLVLSIDKFDQRTYIELGYLTYTKKQAEERYGRFGLGRRGDLVPGTYCNKYFLNCDSARDCLVLSPGFPGIYPRNLSCVYHLEWGGMDNQVRITSKREDFNFVVGGPPCDDAYFCDTREVLTRDNCSGRDYICLYDGPDTSSEVIATFCGKGTIPDIVSSGKHMVIEFVSMESGRFLHNGFEFVSKFVPNFYRVPSSRIVNRKCDWVFYGRLIQSGQLNSVDHWYRPNTICRFRFEGLPNQRVLLYFTSFDTVYDNICKTNLTLYDSKEADHYKLVSTFCGYQRPNLCPQEPQYGEKQGCRPDQRYVSSGPDYYLVFHGTEGSLTGDEFEYKIMYEFINISQAGTPATDAGCNADFYSWTESSSNFSSPVNPLLFGPGGNTNLTCVYSFRGLSFEKIRIIIYQLHLRNSKGCNKTLDGSCAHPTHSKKSVNSLQIYDGITDKKACLCNSPEEKYPLVYTSLTSKVTLNFNVNRIKVREHSDVYNFSARYEFIRFDCGKLNLRGNQGLLLSPNITDRIRCVWTITASSGKHLYLRFLDFYFEKDCETNRLSFYAPEGLVPFMEICRDNRSMPEIFSSGWNKQDVKEETGKIIIELIADDPNGRFHILWSEIYKRYNRNKERNYKVTDHGCEFPCPDGKTCISQSLVCNGIRNCPAARPMEMSWSSADDLDKFLDDESGGGCDTDQSLLYLLLGAVSAVGLLFFVVTIYCIYRCCKYETKEPRYLYR